MGGTAYLLNTVHLLQMFDNLLVECFCRTRRYSIPNLPLDCVPCKFVLQWEALEARELSERKVPLARGVVVSCTAAAGDRVLERRISIPCWQGTRDCGIMIGKNFRDAAKYLIYSHSCLRSVGGFRIRRQALSRTNPSQLK